jgi:hypothetical protein
MVLVLEDKRIEGIEVTGAGAAESVVIRDHYPIQRPGAGTVKSRSNRRPNLSFSER